MPRLTLPLTVAAVLLALLPGCEQSGSGTAPTSENARADRPTPTPAPRPAPPTRDPNPARPPAKQPNTAPAPFGDPGPPVDPPEADPRKDAEPLPDLPKLAPDSDARPLNNEKTFYLETSADKKRKRVLLACEVCLRQGALEVFLCKRGTKEHESIVRFDPGTTTDKKTGQPVPLGAEAIHTALVLIGATPGSPAQFVNPRTNEPEFKPATGTRIRVGVHYRKDGKLHTHPAQEWVWNSKAKKALDTDWVFAGSMWIPIPDMPDAKPFYGADSGELIGVSNFPYSMLELPIEISKEAANLEYEARTDRIPPLFSKVWVTLEPVAGKK